MIPAVDPRNAAAAVLLGLIIGVQRAIDSYLPPEVAQAAAASYVVGASLVPGIFRFADLFENGLPESIILGQTCMAVIGTTFGLACVNALPTTYKALQEKTNDSYLGKSGNALAIMGISVIAGYLTRSAFTICEDTGLSK